MIIVHFFEDLNNIPDFIHELYPDTQLDIYKNQLYVSREGRVFEVKRLTVAIHTNNLQPIDAVDLFLRMKYGTYRGYQINNVIPYIPTDDYTYPDRNLADRVIAIVGGKEVWYSGFNPIYIL